MKKVVSILFIVMLGLALISGCGYVKVEEADSVSKEKTNITIYAQYVDDDTKIPYDYAVKELEKEYPDVNLNLIIQSNDDGATLLSLADAGLLPDIFQSNASIVESMKEKGMIMELDATAQYTGFTDKLLESNKELAYNEDGHIYVFPYAGNEYVLIYYNKAVFEKCGLDIPKTFDDLKKCAEIFRENNIVPFELMSEGWVYTAMYDVIATRFDPRGIVGLDDGSLNINDKAFTEAAKVLYDLSNSGLFQDSVTTSTYEESVNRFFNNESAMLLNGQWFITDAQNNLGDNVDWMFYPSYSEESYEEMKYAFCGGGSTSGFSVNANSKNAKLAAEIAEFMAEKYCEAKVLYRGTPLVAINTGLTSETEYPAMMQKLSDTIPLMTSTTQFAWGLNNSTFYNAITRYSSGLVSGEYTPEKFISHMNNEMNRE